MRKCHAANAANAAFHTRAYAHFKKNTALQTFFRYLIRSVRRFLCMGYRPFSLTLFKSFPNRHRRPLVSFWR